MKPVRTAATLLAGLALTAAPVLTACSQSSEGSDSSSSAASDSSEESDKGDAKDSETQDSKKDAEADKTDKDGDKASASASASATKSDLPKATPAGYQEITAPTIGITFAVPEGWQNTPLDETSDIYYRAPDTGTDPYLQDPRPHHLDSDREPAERRPHPIARRDLDRLLHRADRQRRSGRAQLHRKHPRPDGHRCPDRSPHKGEGGVRHHLRQRRLQRSVHR